RLRREHQGCTAASAGHTAGGRSDEPGEAPPECRQALLVGERDAPLPARGALGVPQEAGADGIEIRDGEQPLPGEHLGVSDRGAHVVGNEPLVERVVLAGGVVQHPFIERRALVPQPLHGALSCSAGVSALTSATTRVPVPSLVNTSPRIPSGERYDTTCTLRTPPRIAFSMAS